jgi:hypothetical protein
MTHELVIRFNAANPAVLRWLQKIQAQSKHPQYGGDVYVSYPRVSRPENESPER